MRLKADVIECEIGGSVQISVLADDEEMKAGIKNDPKMRRTKLMTCAVLLLNSLAGEALGDGAPDNMKKGWILATAKIAAEEVEDGEGEFIKVERAKESEGDSK